MNIIKRALAICLSMALLLTLCPALPIAAAEEQIIFADDFSGYEAEQSPAESTKAEDWNDKATSATAEIKVVEKDKNKVLCITDSAEKAGGPRISKALYLKGVDDLTVTFRAKSEGSASIGFWVLSNNTAVFSHRGAATSWTNFKVEIDLKKKEYVIYADQEEGKKYRAIVKLTEKGVSVTEQIDGIICEVVNEIGKDLEDKERNIMYRSLEIVSKNLDSLAKK